MHGSHVRTRIGFGQTEGAESLTCRQRAKKALLLLLRSPNVNPHGAQTYMHGKNRAERSVDVLQLFRCEAEADVVHAAPTVRFGKADTCQSEVCKLSKRIRL